MVAVMCGKRQLLMATQKQLFVIALLVNCNNNSTKVKVMKKIAQIMLVLSVLYGPFSLAQSKSAPEVKVNTVVKKPLIIYGSDACHHCTDTKKFLNENKIAFVFYDIDKDEKALQEMLAKLKAAKISANGLSIPVIDKDGDVFTNNIAFDDFLKKLK